MELPNGERLMHGTQPYDPQKAHDYYIRTRKLKGRKKGRAQPVATSSKKPAAPVNQGIVGFLNKLPMAKTGASLKEIADTVKAAAKMSNEQLKAAADAEPDSAKASTLNQLLLMRADLQKGAKKAEPAKKAQSTKKTEPPAKKVKTVSQGMLKRQRQQAAARVSSIRSEIADLNKKLKDALAKQKKSEAKAKRGPTKAEKSEKARDAKKYRDKNKQKLKNKRSATSKDKASGKADSVESIKNKISEAKGRLAKAVARQKALG